MEKVHKINEYISVIPSSEPYIIILPIVNTVKSEKHCSYKHFAGTVQKVGKIMENPKCRNVKSRF